MDNNESLSLKNHPVELTRVLKSYQLFRIFQMSSVQYHSDFLSLVSTLTDHPFFFCQFFSSGNGGFSPNKFKKGTETVKAPKNYFQRQNFRPPYFLFRYFSPIDFLRHILEIYFSGSFFRYFFWRALFEDFMAKDKPESFQLNPVNITNLSEVHTKFFFLGTSILETELSDMIG